MSTTRARGCTGCGQPRATLGSKPKARDAKPSRGKDAAEPGVAAPKDQFGALVQRLNPITDPPEVARVPERWFSSDAKGRPVHFRNAAGEPIAKVADGQEFLIRGPAIEVKVRPPEGVPASEAVSSGMTAFAVANEVREMCEAWLGHPIDWAAKDVLDIEPYAKCVSWTELNAYASTKKRADGSPDCTMGFYYFTDTEAAPSEAFVGPGGMHLSTPCRDPEVVAHETGHQVVSAETYLATGKLPDKESPGYDLMHEVMGDVISFLHGLGQPSVIQRVREQCGGDLHHPNTASHNGETFDYLISRQDLVPSRDTLAALLRFGDDAIRRGILSDLAERVDLNVGLNLEDGATVDAQSAVERAFDAFARELGAESATGAVDWSAVGPKLVTPASQARLQELLCKELASSIGEDAARQVFDLGIEGPANGWSYVSGSLERAGAALVDPAQGNQDPALLEEVDRSIVQMREGWLAGYDENTTYAMPGRRYHELSKYDPAKTEAHDASECFGSAAYGVLADLVSAKMEAGLSFEQALSAARSSVGSVALRSIQLVPDLASMTAEDFAKALLESARRYEPETLAVWKAAFEAREIPA